MNASHPVCHLDDSAQVPVCSCKTQAELQLLFTGDVILDSFRNEMASLTLVLLSVMPVVYPHSTVCGLDFQESNSR